MSNIIQFSRPPEVHEQDASALLTMPMPEVYRVATQVVADSPSGWRGIVKVLRVTARFLVGSAAGAQGRRPEAMGLTVEGALRRACDLLDLADEIEMGTSPTEEGL